MKSPFVQAGGQWDDFVGRVSEENQESKSTMNVIFVKSVKA